MCINTRLVQFLWRALTSTSVRPRGKIFLINLAMNSIPLKGWLLFPWAIIQYSIHSHGICIKIECIGEGVVRANWRLVRNSHKAAYETLFPLFSKKYESELKSQSDQLVQKKTATYTSYLLDLIQCLEMCCTPTPTSVSTVTSTFHSCLPLPQAGFVPLGLR